MVAAGLGANSIDTRGKFRTELDALATAEALLDAGADVERARRARPHGAARTRPRKATRDVAKLLVERGADVAAKDADGVTPIDAANGKLRGGRGPGVVHADTAALLTELSAAAR